VAQDRLQHPRGEEGGPADQPLVTQVVVTYPVPMRLLAQGLAKCCQNGADQLLKSAVKIRAHGEDDDITRGYS